MHDRLGYVDTAYLDTIKAGLQLDKQHSYELLDLEPGASVLEVGCGPATDTLALAELVGSTGRVVGVDLDPEMVDEANQRVEVANLAGRVTHQKAEATDLPFEDNSFDGVRSERLFQHTPGPAAALGEMARVVRPGGRIVVFDMDWGTLSTDTRETDVERRLMRFKAERMHTNGYAGRQLYRLFHEAKLRNVQVEPRQFTILDHGFLRLAASLDDVESKALEAGWVTEAELERWRAGLNEADANGAVFSSGSMMMATGTKG